MVPSPRLLGSEGRVETRGSTPVGAGRRMRGRIPAHDMAFPNGHAHILHQMQKCNKYRIKQYWMPALQ